MDKYTAHAVKTVIAPTVGVAAVFLATYIAGFRGAAIISQRISK